MVSKGALKNILEVCTNVEKWDGSITGIETDRDNIQKHFEEFSNKGFRTLGVAYKNIGTASQISKDRETGMTFSGFLILLVYYCLYFMLLRCSSEQVGFWKQLYQHL